MTSAELCLLESSARRAFKKMAGQNNHFLITILVGLAAVEDGTATLPDGMHVSWAPRDRKSSATRSREFAIKSSLAWLTDALSVYIRELIRAPSVANKAMIKGITQADSHEEGLRGRVRAVTAATGQTGSGEATLVEVAIVWRNSTVHQTNAGKFSKQLASEAREHAAQFSELYQGLHIEDLIARAERRPAAAPTLKEITALIRAAHKWVERVDRFLLQDLELEPYLKEILRMHLMGSEDANPQSIMVRASRIWSKLPDRRKSAIVQVAYNSGLSSYSEGAQNKVTTAFIDKLASMSPAEAVTELCG